MLNPSLRLIPDTNKPRLPFLDGIRGVAIGLVVIYDYFATFYHPTPDSNVILAYLDHVFEAGWGGVDLFFVLSGFLIGGILIDHRLAENYYRPFYTRRAYRILPLYILIAAPLFIAPLFSGQIPRITEYVSSGDIRPFWHLFFAQNIIMAVLGSFGERWIATTWSLAVEEQFYAAAPPLVRWLSPTGLGGVNK